jgi:hypothetical protein
MEKTMPEGDDTKNLPCIHTRSSFSGWIGLQPNAINYKERV